MHFGLLYSPQKVTISGVCPTRVNPQREELSRKFSFLCNNAQKRRFMEWHLYCESAKAFRTKSHFVMTKIRMQKVRVLLRDWMELVEVRERTDPPYSIILYYYNLQK